MKASTVIAATGITALASARAIPNSSSVRSVAINGTDPNSSARARANSLNLTRQADINSGLGARTQNVSTLVVNATRYAGQDRREHSRSASLSATAAGEVNASKVLQARTTYNSNGDGRYLPNANCTETGVWDTRNARCKMNQDDIDAANQRKKDKRNANIGIGVTAGICGPIVLGAAAYGISRCCRGR